MGGTTFAEDTSRLCRVVRVTISEELSTEAIVMLTTEELAIGDVATICVAILKVLIM